MRQEYAELMVDDSARSSHGGQPDADLHLRVEGQVTLTSLIRLVESWTGFLDEIGRRVTGNPSRHAVRYMVTEASGGSFAVGVRPQSASEDVPARMMPQIARAVLSGLQELEREPKRPPHFSDGALDKLQDLARLAGPDTPSLMVSDGGHRRRVALSSEVLEHVEAVLTPAFQSIGTIEGELEGLIIHGQKRFFLYDRLAGRKIICYFGDSVDWEEIRDLLGKRIAVTGEIHSRRSGERASINVSSVYVFPRKEDLPSPDEVRGLLRDAE